MNSKIKWWHVIAATIIVSAIGALSTFTSNREETKLYTDQLQQAPWAPPSWLFGPAWTLNNFFLLVALRMLINHPNLLQRRRLLNLQIPIWIIFFSFGYVYFRKKSPVLAAAWTIADFILTLSSILIARRADKKLAACYAPLLAWTGFASTVAAYQVLYNPDPITGNALMIE